MALPSQSHICVLQTALDLLERDYEVHVLADGVSSCNKEEVPLALERMRQAKALITTSESAAYQLMGASPLRGSGYPANVHGYLADAGKPEFKAFSQVIKEETETARNTLQALPGRAP